MADWGDKFASAWIAIKRKAGACAANADLDDLKASVQLGQKRVDQALMVGSFLQGKSDVFEKLNKANEGLGKDRRGTGKGPGHLRGYCCI